jgi:hypothetical protein
VNVVIIIPFHRSLSNRFSRARCQAETHNGEDVKDIAAVKTRTHRQQSPAAIASIVLWVIRNCGEEFVGNSFSN